MLSIHAVAICNKGKVRDNNEDNLIFQSHILDEIHEGIEGMWKQTSVNTNRPWLYGVFDGMGGHSKGEYASYSSADVARKMMRNFQGNKDEIHDFLNSICIEANEKVCRKEQSENRIMGTTASFIYIYEEECWCCNIGDSPIFRIREGVLTEFYEEHTERKFREMIFGKDKVKGKKFPLTQHIGIPKEEMQIQPFYMSEQIKQGDQYLICSDGLTDMVSKEEILNIMRENTDIEEKILLLEQKAMEYGGRDNITIICVEVK